MCACPVSDFESPDASGGADVLSPEMFDEVLERDLANIVRKAYQAGQPLTKREREMIEEARAKSQKPLESAFKLEGEGGMAALAGLTQAELAEKWGYSVRALKAWVRRGKDVKDPAPLSDPAAMPAWFERVFSPRECPDRLHLAVQRLLSEGSVFVESKTERPAEITVLDLPEESKGLLAMLGRARGNEAVLYAKYQRAVDDGDENKASFLRKEWADAGEKLRALEKTAPKALEELGIYVRRDDVRRDLAPIHAAIIKSFEQGIRNNRLRLRGAQNQAEWNRVSAEIVAEIREALCESSFAEPLELEVGE